MFNNFVNRYKVSKTLRFELKPVGKTLENIKKFNMLVNDEIRDKQYERMKNILDLQHRALIERSLTKIGKEADVQGWIALADAYRKYRANTKDKDVKSVLDKALEKLRKMIVSSFTEDEMYKELIDSTPSKFIKRMKNADKNEEVHTAFTIFDSFACYFTGYQENRKNIYSDKAQTTAAAYRAIDVNFPKFLEAVDIFGHIAEKYPQIIKDVEEELGGKLCGKSLSSIFSIENYGNYLSQSGIDFYNLVLGGYTSNAMEKKRGLNEFINLTRQQNENGAIDIKLHRISPLYKQILSERESESFRFTTYKDGVEVIRAVKDFATQFKDDLVAENMKGKLAAISKSEKIYINGGTSLAAVSKNLCGNWNALGSCMYDAAEIKYAVLGKEKKIKAAVEKWMDSKAFSLADLPDVTVVDENSDDGVKTIRITDCWRNDSTETIFKTLDLAFEALTNMPDKDDKDVAALNENEKMILKNYLDAVLNVLHLVKPLSVGAEFDRDMEFYTEFDELYARIEEVVPLYNKVRNFATKKVGEIEKMKLMFDCDTLGVGWDLNRESANHSMIFVKDRCYYLGIAMSSDTVLKIKANQGRSNDVYEKMEYKQMALPMGVGAFVRKCFGTCQSYGWRCPKECLNAEGKIIIKDEEAKKVLPILIDCYKDFLDKYEKDGFQYKEFGFRFKDSKSYSKLSEFFADVERFGYKLWFRNVDVELINELVSKNELCLFKIYNKDFAKGAHGKPNLHTIYWNSIFNKENLSNPVVQLNGGAELFYRPIAIKTPYVHEIGDKMLNRWTKAGEPIPEREFGELFDFITGKVDKSKLSNEAKMLLESSQLVIKPATHKIIKDARYAEEKFFFHVPISMNAFSGDVYRFNDEVNVTVNANDNVNVIGLDRGERNLIYLTLINKDGEIILQKSFNTVTGATYDGKVRTVDYQKKLTTIEKGRDVARKSWSEIGRIKDLKDGYLSLVVHEIVSLMVQYNAIIVMEDLNFGFKRGRFKVERQVYQKFEKALIDKLNYLVFKDKGATEFGGVLKGYQLAAKFESFEKLGKQTGFIYYVPAGYTSKIDPTTGFTNLFNTKKCTNAVGIAEFFSKFDSIIYDAKMNSFAFKFNYLNFKVSQTSWKKDWIVYSADRRIIFNKESGHEKEQMPTQMILDELEKAGEKVVDGFDLKAFLTKVEPCRTNATIFRNIFYAFDWTLHMRNSCASTGEDYISSPVKNKDGVFFDSRKVGDDLPKDADANGAYHIALKGLYLIKNRLGQEKIDLKITNEQWFEFVQNR